MTVSLQLYSMRDCSDQIALLGELPAMGITQVEGYGGLYGDPKAYRSAMEANGISMPSGHMGLDDIEANFDGAMDIVLATGMERVFAPYLEERDRPKSTLGYTVLAERLNTIGLRLAEYGISFGWHNHDFEFETLPDGNVPMEILLTCAPDISWEVDVAWIVRSGLDPLEYIRRHGNRITAIHVKDIAEVGMNVDQDGWADLGAGTLDWDTYLTACRQLPNDILYILEHDKPVDPIKFAARSAAAFKALWESAND